MRRLKHQKTGSVRAFRTSDIGFKKKQKAKKCVDRKTGKWYYYGVATSYTTYSVTAIAE